MGRGIPLAVSRSLGILPPLCMLAAAPCAGQRLIDEFSICGDYRSFEHVSKMSISPNGQELAISDEFTNRVLITDLRGHPLWVAGERADFGHPYAICLLSERELLFAEYGGTRILRTTRERPVAFDEIADLGSELGVDGRIDQIVRSPRGTYIILDEGNGTVLEFDRFWNARGTAILRGSGTGKVLLPSSIAATTAGNIVVTDRKNFPVQVFSQSGEFLFRGGWNEPRQDRHWISTASTVDLREIIWVADETNAQLRRYDPAGMEQPSVSFGGGFFLPIALVAAADNTILAIDSNALIRVYSCD